MKLYPLLFTEAIIPNSETNPIPEDDLSDKTASTKEVQNNFSHFHLSRKFLGAPTFTFTPRVPSEPFVDKNYNVIEDDFTPRISIAPTINDAVKALQLGYPRTLYIYATNNGNIKSMDRLEDCPKDPPAKYGVKFLLLPWLKTNYPDVYKNYLVKYGKKKLTNIGPKELPQDIRNQFYGCIPDADRTHEEWSESPIDMIFVGTFISNDPTNKVRLSKQAAALMGK